MIAKMEISENIYPLLAGVGYSEQRISWEARSIFAAYLFKRDVLSLGKAAELAEFPLEHFISLLDQLEIPVIDYEDDELDAEFETARKLSDIL